MSKKKKITDIICPSCGKDGDVIDLRCRKCGARQTVNQVSGNIIWIRNGRLVKAFKDSKDAYVNMAMLHGIPESQWPEEYRR